MSEKKVTTEDFLDDEDNIRALRSYAKRENKKFGTKEEALEDFLGTYRGVMSNTGLAVMFANEVADIKDDGERLELGRLYRAVDEDLEDFAGQQSGLATTAEYIGKGILDPLNILGFGVGSIVGRSIGKIALNRIISNAFKGNISKEISKGAAKKTVGLGTGIGGVEGVGQGLSIENVKGADKLGLQDEMDLGNVALMGGIGAITGGAFGALGGRSAAKQLTKAGEVIKKQVETIENTAQGKIARSATVQNFVDKQTGTFNPLSVIGTYVKPTDQTKKLIDDPENYGEFGLIKSIIDGKAEVEFLPTTFGQTKNPKTGLFDERKTTLVEFNKIKGVSEANKRTYQKKFVDNYGLFFSKADIEKGKDLLRADPSISIPELDTIFEVGLKQEDFENVSSLVFDVAQNFLENTKIDPNTASTIKVIMDDPMKRISEKFGELIRLGNKDRNLLSDSIANNLVRYNLTQEQFSHALLADISISMTKGSQMSSIKKLVDTNSRIGNKLEQMRKNLTPSQASVFEAVKVQREAERAMANKFGIFVDIWRSFLVTQPATTFRNVFGSALRVPGETLDISLQSSKFFTQFESKALGMDIPEPDLKNESLLLSKNLLNPLEQIELATIIAKEFPEAKRKVFDVFDDYFAVTLGDDSRAGGFLKKLSFASKVANVANRAQDRAIKSAGLMTELDNQVKTAIRRGEITDPKVKGIIDLIEQNKLNLVNDEMISKSLQFAYKLTYQSRNAGDEVIGVGGLINTIQNGLNKIAIAKLGVPFPNFLINGFVYTLNRGLGGGILKAAVKGAQTIGASKQVAKNEREKINDLTGKISAAVKKGIKSQKQKNNVATMRKEVAALEAKAGKRLQNVEQFRKGVVESAEGISLIAAGYGIRETMGGARYDELKIGNTTINVGPLFPLTPFLFLGELIRKKLNDEPIDAKLIGEGAQALTGLQTDRAGPFAKFIGGTQKFLSEINTDDPLAAKKTGELLGGMIGYIVKGFYTPFKAFDDLAKDLGPAELRQTFEKGFQEFITEEGDTYSKEMARGVFNEFTRQMFRGTSFQTGVFGEESASRPLQSVTGPVKSKPSYFAKQPSGLSLPIPRGDLGDELARVGIDDYKLEVRSEVPEYTFQYKKILGELAKRNLEPIIQTDTYKKLPIDAQKAGLLGEYKGVSGLTDEEKRAFKGLGFEFENLKQVTSNTIKTQMPFLHNLHNFRKRYTKDEIRKLYRDKKAEGNPIPQLKYVGEATTDRGVNYAAEEQNKKLDEYAELINRDRKRRGLIGGRYTLGGKPSPTGRRDGGYVTQINAFKEGGIVSKKNLNFLKNFHNTVVEEGRERLEGDDTGPESVTTMRIIGLMADLGDGEKEYLLPSYDPETKEVLDPEGKSKEERNIIYQKIISKFLPAILDGQIEGYSSEQKAEEDRKKIYKNIVRR